MISKDIPRPLIIGEVLFDCFPERRVLGGAPFNVAWNLKGLGLDPLLVTAIGADEPGDQVRKAMDEWGLQTAALQVRGHATGRVDIHLHDGEPSYEFWENVAYDHIQLPDITLDGSSFDLLYHGSLAMRASQTRNTILELRRFRRCPVFVDINIRKPYFEPGWVNELLSDTDHLKLSVDELLQLTPTEAMSENVSRAEGETDWDVIARRAIDLKARYSIDNVWITAGGSGAAWVGLENEPVVVPATTVASIVDTVGAGDAFTATIIFGLLNRWRPLESLQAATEFASRVCGLRGAIATDRQFYSRQITV